MVNSGITYTINPTEDGLWELKTDKWLTGSTSHPEIKDEQIVRAISKHLIYILNAVLTTELKALEKQNKNVGN
jgi:hypothetical protein